MKKTILKSGLLVACSLLLAGSLLGVGASGCELVVQLDPALVDASPSDACPICNDVSVDANYDGDVSIYGQPPSDAGSVDAGDDVTAHHEEAGQAKDATLGG